ncbi:predicted protein [Uncinocarpus reesii 1704]|uniref:Spo12-like protein n=1 Tax=Uncinocarpus reesii (strain UAMH 1704) TaxID=336963 RepID=C4JND8_UNCRE|nr:uncharacterized protein UREG_04344 [Uncinocarpus reesii 1704]EEP79498.1 predicted protein [Uncinocarpus reesii 1704]
MAANATSPSKSLPLSDKSTNVFLPSPAKASNEDKAATKKSLEHHRQVLREKLQEGSLKAPGHYVSPSDNIMSPCTKRLTDMKVKMLKNMKPQALFAKTIAKKSYEKMSSEDPNNGGNAA